MQIWLVKPRCNLSKAGNKDTSAYAAWLLLLKKIDFLGPLSHTSAACRGLEQYKMHGRVLKHVYAAELGPRPLVLIAEASPSLPDTQGQMSPSPEAG